MHCLPEPALVPAQVLVVLRLTVCKLLLGSKSVIMAASHRVWAATWRLLSCLILILRLACISTAQQVDRCSARTWQGASYVLPRAIALHLHQTLALDRLIILSFLTCASSSVHVQLATRKVD